MNQQNIENYFARLGESVGARFYLVGGALRDELLGLEPKDYDFIAHGVELDDLVRRLEEHGEVEVIGARFSVVQYRPDEFPGSSFEIALPRTEKRVGSGRTKGVEARVDPYLPLDEDLARRDFTINALAKDVKTGLLIDPLSGKFDIEHRTLRVLHDQSFRDDPLRMLRGIRFVSEHDLNPTFSTEELYRRDAHLLADQDELSLDRIRGELLRIVSGPHALRALLLMEYLGMLRHVLPELQSAVGCTQNSYHQFDVWRHSLRVLHYTESEDPEVRLAALLHDVGKPPTRWFGPDGVPHFYRKKDDHPYGQGGEPEIEGAHEEVGAGITRDILTRLRFSNREIDRISGLVRLHMFSQGPHLKRPAARRLLQRLSQLPGDLGENVTALFAIRYGDCQGGKRYDNGSLEAKELEEALENNRRFERMVRKELEQDCALSTKDLCLGGHELMRLGLQGPDIGRVQRVMLRLVTENPVLNTPEAYTDVVLKYKEACVD